MAAYATADDVRSAVARDPLKATGTAALLEDDAINAEIGNAQAEVDAKLRNRYPLPLETVPTLVKAITVDIGAYLATLVYYQGKDLADDDPVVRRYKRAKCLLDDIATGKADLDTGDGDSPAPSGGGFGAPINPNVGRLFSGSDFGLSTCWAHDDWC